MDQRTEEWFQARLGRVTASRIADVMAKLRSGEPAAGRTNYAAQLIAERLTGQPTEGFTNAAMQWGTDTEPQARAMYSLIEGQEVEEVGFIPHPTLFAGASPDGLVGAEGLVEIKCPNTATHIARLRGAPIDGKYLKQMHFQMACTGRKWCDFVSFDPRMPDHMQIDVERVMRDQAAIDEIETEIAAFLAEVDAAVADLTSRYGEKAA